MPAFLALIDNKKTDLVFICETWFTEDSCPNIPGYNLFYKNRVQRSGGGVCIYINSKFASFQILEHDLGLSNPDSETVWCSVKTSQDSILLGCIYRPGDSSDAVNSQINISLLKAKSLLTNGRFTGILVVGDFNFRDLIWDESGQGSFVNISTSAKKLNFS